MLAAPAQRPAPSDSANHMEIGLCVQASCSILPFFITGGVARFPELARAQKAIDIHALYEHML